MRSGFKRSDGVFLPRTRMGITVTITGKEKLNIADNVFVGQYTFLEASNGLTIEEGVQIGYNNLIATHSSHMSIRLYGDQYDKVEGPLKGYVTGEVFIGKYTFIGPHCTVMPKTHIGKGSIVSAYSMVSGKFPDFSIISGNPAKVVGDTRKLDERMLQRHPELREYYDEWAKD